jgi:hypothetical protein
MNNIITLSRRYPQFKQEEIFELQSAFNRLADGNDSIDKQTAMQAAVDRKRVHFDQARKTLLNEVRLDSSGTVGFEEFVEVCERCRKLSGATLIRGVVLFQARGCRPQVAYWTRKGSRKKRLEHLHRRSWSNFSTHR